MSTFISAVRATLIAVVVASPAAALAQTASDVAQLVGQQDVTFVSAAPAVSSGFAGAGSAADLTRLIDAHGVTANVAAVAPRGTSFSALDVARLSGVAAPVSQTLFVGGNSKIAVADGVQH
jgi:nucleoid-associated protein YgaU